MSTRRDAYAKAIAALAEIKVDLVFINEAQALVDAMHKLQEAREYCGTMRLDIEQ